MKSLSPLVVLMLALLIAVLAACTRGTSEPDGTGVQPLDQGQVVGANVELATPEPTSTSSSMSQPTATATSEPSPTATATATPSPTDMPEPTATPTTTPEPTSTPTPKPELVVEAGSINIRGGPGTNYQIVSAVLQGEQLAVLGQISECQWLEIETDGGDSGWVTGSSDYVSLNLDCGAIPVVNAPPPPAVTSAEETGSSGAAAPSQPAPAGGTARITAINETSDRGASVFLRTCCERFQISTEPGETKVLDLPADEYAWSLQHHNCRADLPQLFLVAGMEIVVRFIPIETGCGLYADITHPDG